jgi:hypothetical protein
MEKYGISRAELAREMGKSEQEVGRWFNSERRFANSGRRAWRTLRESKWR